MIVCIVCIKVFLPLSKCSSLICCYNLLVLYYLTVMVVCKCQMVSEYHLCKVLVGTFVCPCVMSQQFVIYLFIIYCVLFRLIMLMSLMLVVYLCLVVSLVNTVVSVIWVQDCVFARSMVLMLLEPLCLMCCVSIIWHLQTVGNLMWSNVSYSQIFTNWGGVRYLSLVNSWDSLKWTETGFNLFKCKLFFSLYYEARMPEYFMIPMQGYWLLF